MRFSRLFRVTLLLGALVSTALFAGDDEADVAAVIAAEKARGDALVAADLKQLDKLLADDLRYTHSNNKLESKAIFIGTFASGLCYEKFVTFELHGHVIVPGVVVLTGQIDQRKGMNGKFSGRDPKLMFHAVWRRDPDGWRLASMETAALSVPVPAAPKKG